MRRSGSPFGQKRKKIEPPISDQHWQLSRYRNCQVRKHESPLFLWYKSLEMEERARVLRERLGVSTIRTLQTMFQKHADGLKQLKRYLYSNVMLENAEYNFISAEQKLRIFPVLLPSLKDEKAEAGDLANTSWDEYDETLVKHFLIFASKRNGEIDAFTLSESLLKDENWLFDLMVKCTRGTFLSGDLGYDLEIGLSMDWFTRRSFSSLATILAHLIEVKLWKEYWVKNPPKFPKYVQTDAKESLEDKQKRKIKNEEFEKEITKFRRGKDVCPAPTARASVEELTEFFVALSPDKKLRLISKDLKTHMCKLCSERMEDQENPVLLPPPYLEPANKGWISKRIRVLWSSPGLSVGVAGALGKKKKGSGVKKEPTQIKMLASLVDLFGGSTSLLIHLMTQSAQNFIASLFAVPLSDSFGLRKLGLLCGSRLEDMYSANMAQLVSASFVSGNSVLQLTGESGGGGGSKKKKKKKKKAKKKAVSLGQSPTGGTNGMDGGTKQQQKQQQRPAGNDKPQEGRRSGAAKSVSGSVSPTHPSQSHPVDTETESSEEMDSARLRSMSFGEDATEVVAASIAGKKAAKSISTPQTTASSPAKQRKSQKSHRHKPDFSRRKSEESLSFVITEPPSYKAKSSEVSKVGSPRDLSDDEANIPMPPHPRAPVPPNNSRLRSGSSDNARHLVATAAPFKLRSRTTDYMWRRENEVNNTRNTDAKLQSNLSSVLDLQPSAKTLVLTKEIYSATRRMEEFVMAQRPYREAAIAKIREIVRDIWPQAHVEVFGSYSTDLCLPSSDIDIVVVGAPNAVLGETPGQQPLGILTKEFISNHTKWFSKVQAIPTARIPIIKLVYKSRNEKLGPLGDIPVDITFTSEATKIHSGVAARELVKQLVQDYRDLKPLAFILKQFLFQRGLSNLFSGGMSSYCLVLMIATFLQAYGLDARDKNVGALLLDFLDLFGRRFDFSRTGVSMSGGSFFELSPVFAGKVPLWIDDPFNPGTNIGANSFAMYRVKASFDLAFQTLNRPYSYDSVRTYLGRILHDYGGRRADLPPKEAATANLRKSQENVDNKGKNKEGGDGLGNSHDSLHIAVRKGRSLSISPNKAAPSTLTRQISTPQMNGLEERGDVAEAVVADSESLSPDGLRSQFRQQNELEQILRDNLREEKTKTNYLQTEIELKNETILELEKKLDMQKQEMEKMRQLLEKSGK